jgi:hypothetical protein
MAAAGDVDQALARILNQLVDSARLFTAGWADPQAEVWLRRQLERLRS